MMITDIILYELSFSLVSFLLSRHILDAGNIEYNSHKLNEGLKDNEKGYYIPSESSFEFGGETAFKVFT